MNISQYTLESTNPFPSIQDGHPKISYLCSLYRDGKHVISCPFHLGVGYVQIPNYLPFLPSEFEPLYNLLRRNSLAIPKDKMLYARFAVWLAIRQGVKPSLDNFLECILLDGKAYFDHLTFIQWAGEFGYSSDLISAETIYNTCIKTGRELESTLGREEVDRLLDEICFYF